ncbi:MAG: hypothetical protein LAQ69_34410 [Acidobacteriia bacterium]|nr:hypothetical protein [Terriglobia bacterium]
MNLSLQTSVSALLLMLDLWRRKQGEELCVPETWRSAIRRMAYEIARAQEEFILQGLVLTVGARAHRKCTSLVGFQDR